MAELKLNEIFYSIQGEGSRAGLPCVFIRLQGCGLRCAWCDTSYALDSKDGGELWTHDAIINAVSKYKCNFIELTGGEPLEQTACLPLMTELCDLGYSVAVETGGHVDISAVDPRVIIIMDMKCPGSGMTKRNLLSNLDYLKPTDEIKFVIRDREDYDWARDAVRKHRLKARCHEILFAPVFGELENSLLASWILDDRLPVRLQLQLQKYIWEPGRRGV